MMPAVHTFPCLLRDDGAPKGALKTPIKGEALQQSCSSTAVWSGAGSNSA